MDESLISVRYAKALFIVSKEKNIMDILYNDMFILQEQCVKDSEFMKLLESPVLTAGQKKKTFKSIFDKYVNEVTLNFFGILVDNRREGMLSSVSRNFIDFYKEEKGIKSVTLYTAYKLPEDYVLEIREVLHKELNAEIELSVRVRDNLIGGFVLMVDGKMMDASILNRLKKLKNKLLS